MTNKNILLTGGLGHIGSHLVRHLPETYDLTVVDNLYTQRYCSLFNINNTIKFIECSFIDTPLEAIKQSDVIIHLAAITNAASSFNNDDIGKVNIQQTKKFIDICKQESNAKFVFPSSTSVYGISSDIVLEDDDSFLNPQSPYAESKIEIENYIKSSDMEYIILRLGTIFGHSAGIRFHTAINKFCYQAAIGVPLTVWKQNYNQYRPYLGVNDCVKAIEILLEHGASQTTYNTITNNFKLSDIVNYINSIMSVDLQMIDTPLLNQHSYKVNMDKLMSLGFVPNDDIHESISSTIGMFSGINNTARLL